MPMSLLPPLNARQGKALQQECNAINDAKLLSETENRWWHVILSLFSLGLFLGSTIQNQNRDR